jgi:hypothetical protein
MLRKVNDAPANPPYWVCTLCNWPFMSLQEANRHAQDCTHGYDIEEKNEVGPE